MRKLRFSMIPLSVGLFLHCLGLPMASAQNAVYYACVTNSTGDIVIVPKTTVCQAGQTRIHWNQTGPSGIYYSGTNLGTLTTTPTSILQPAPQITDPGSYMLLGNVSIEGSQDGGYEVDTCYLQAGSTQFRLIRHRSRVLSMTT